MRVLGRKIKKCKFCFEVIKFEAIKCKHCGNFQKGNWYRSSNPAIILTAIAAIIPTTYLIFNHLMESYYPERAIITMNLSLDSQEQFLGIKFSTSNKMAVIIDEDIYCRFVSSQRPTSTTKFQNGDISISNSEVIKKIKFEDLEFNQSLEDDVQCEFSASDRHGKLSNLPKLYKVASTAEDTLIYVDERGYEAIRRRRLEISNEFLEDSKLEKE